MQMRAARRHVVGAVLSAVVLAGCPTEPVDDGDGGNRLGAPCTVDDECDGYICVERRCSVAGSSSSGGMTSSSVVSSTMGSSSSPGDAGIPDAYVPTGIIQVEPATGPIEFGAQRIGQAVEKTVVVTNTGDAPFNVVQVGIRYADGAVNNGEFSVVPVGPAPSSLAPEAQFSWRVVHTPVDGIPDRAFLLLVTTAANAPSVELELVAEFKGDPALAVHDTPGGTGANVDAVFVGSTPVGATVTRSLYVRNTGAADSGLTLEGVTVAGMASPFTVSAGVLPRGLSSFPGTCSDASTCAAPATACTDMLCTVEPSGGAPYPLDAVRVDVTFTAAAEGSATGTLTFTGRAGNTPFQHDVALTAVGLGSTLVVEPTPVTFGAVRVMMTEDRTLTLTNAGNGPLLVQQVRWLADVPAFSLDTSAITFPATIAAMDTLQFPVTFSPVDPGLYEATLQVVLPNRIQSVQVTGTGQPPPATRSAGGAITGLLGTGLVLQNNMTDGITVSPADLRYAFPVTDGAGYNISVAVQPSMPTQVCNVANASGVVVGADVTNADVTCVTRNFAVRGTISGLTGAGLVLQNNGGADLAVAANAQAFSFTVPSGGAYGITVRSQPTAPSQTCVVMEASGTVVDADVENVQVPCTTNAYQVGGSVTGLAGGGLVLETAGGETVTVPANADRWSMPLPSGSTYAFSVREQPTQPWQTCNVVNATGAVQGADITNVNVTCTTRTYAVGGTISGLQGTGLVLRNSGGQQVAVAPGTTTFSFNLLSGSDYAITVGTQPTAPSQSCVVTNGTGAVGGAIIDNVRVTCGTNTFSVGGTITGLVGTGLVLAEQGGGQITAAPGATSYGFPLESGSPFNITVMAQPQDPSQVCTVQNATGEVAGANITNAHVTCVTRSFRVGGTITGLQGSGLVLQVNNGSDLGVASDATQYAFTRPSGSTYSITVRTQPIGPSQACAVMRGSGMVGGEDINDVDITCTTLAFAVGGTVSGLVGSATVGLQLNGGSTTSTGNGAFTFASPVLSGQPWSVTVSSQPANHLCTVQDGSGAIGGGAVSNVAVTCQWNTVLLFATSSQLRGDGTSAHVVARWQAGGAWTSSNLAGVSSLGNALVVTGTGKGVALVQATPSGAYTESLLRFTTWDGSAWSALADTGSTVFTRSQPSLSSAAGRTDAASVFHGGDFQHYAMTRGASAWTFEGAVGGAFGPNAPVIQARGADATMAFVRGSAPVNRPAVMDRVGGTWGAPVNLADEEAAFDARLGPSIVAPRAGAELMVAWHTWDPTRNTYKLRYAVRNGGTWSAANDITYAWTDARVALAALPGGDVLAAYRRTDIGGAPRLWTSVYSAATGTWSNPRDTTWTLVGAPAVTRGVGGDYAEVAFIGTDRRAYHCRMPTSEGECPNTVSVAQDVDHVSLATVP